MYSWLDLTVYNVRSSQGDVNITHGKGAGINMRQTYTWKMKLLGTEKTRWGYI